MDYITITFLTSGIIVLLVAILATADAIKSLGEFYARGGKRADNYND